MEGSYMSCFSGKCDLRDIIEIHGGFENFNGVQLFIGDKQHPLSYTSLKDLIPYYPYIEIAGSNTMMILSEKSWVDIEEERYGKMQMHDIYRDRLKKEIQKFEDG